ncbi:MAG: anti-sigma factor antagonist [Clostridia bacterium]|nr:anti-sigma factor antagonist [Clostridia bacterium]
MKTEISGVVIHMKNDEMLCVLGGDIDHHSARTVRMQIDEDLYRRRPQKLVLDLSKVEFMDSSGLGLILGRFSKASEIGAECVLLNPNENVTKILDVAGIKRLIRIERSFEKNDHR